MAKLKQYAAEPMAEVPEMKELIDKKMKEMAELKPCPFCGNEGDCIGLNRDIETHDYWVSCAWCFSSGPLETSKKRAIDAWNKRS